jgi:urease accessory protein
MLRARHVRPPSTSAPADELVLDWDARRRHRFRGRLASGEEIGVLLPRGSALTDGDELEAEDGRRIRVRAAHESLSVARSDDALLFARLAYHLGNRHVPLQIEPGRLLYQHDHVLDDLVRGLGGEVTFESAVFSPEGGAYGQGHSHSDSHSPDHSHSHSHPHSHSHSHSHPHPHPHPHSPSPTHDHAPADDPPRRDHS